MNERREFREMVKIVITVPVLLLVLVLLPVLVLVSLEALKVIYCDAMNNLK